MSRLHRIAASPSGSEGKSSQSFLQAIRDYVVRNGGADLFPDYDLNLTQAESAQARTAREERVTSDNEASGKKRQSAELGKESDETELGRKITK